MDDEVMSKHNEFITSLMVEKGRPLKAAIEKTRNITIHVWKLILQAQPELNQMGDLYLKQLPGRSDGSSVMNLIDEVFKRLNFSKKELFLTDTDAWNHALDTYFNDVQTIIVEEVVQGVIEKAESRQVTESIGTHFNWVWFDHSHLYHHGCLPLLSPSVLMMMIQVFKGIGEGVTKVHQILLQFDCIVGG
jgi:hypothetical protein